MKCDQCGLKFYYYLDWMLHICKRRPAPTIREE